MFCPACSAYLSEKDLVKTAVKYAPGNVPIEYDARCPNCAVEMGRVSWGQLTVNPDLANKQASAPPSSAPNAQESYPPMPQKDGTSFKKCPHCGKNLPEGF